MCITTNDGWAGPQSGASNQNKYEVMFGLGSEYNRDREQGANAVVDKHLTHSFPVFSPVVPMFRVLS